ncbi:MAG: glycosyltransferase [Planctomycetes bacterium]|nr:glycosyltransferase [Planctomycetota bacterium]
MSGDTASGRLRVVHLTSAHPPDDIRIVRHELMTLSAHGIDVTLIAPRHARPAPEGVRVLHVPAPASRWQRMAHTTRAIYRLAVSADADVYHFHDPELIPVGILLKLRGKRVAFVSTRIAGKDGVSLEIEKWAAVLERLGVECFYLAGECDRPAERTALIETAHFSHPDILDITQRAFESSARSAQLTDDILESARTLRNQLNQALDKFAVDAIIAQNALTIPMNIPLGIALVHVIQERGLGCVAHHHDFYWERDRFSVNAIGDLLSMAFPPSLPSIAHVTINSAAQQSLSHQYQCKNKSKSNTLLTSVLAKPFKQIHQHRIVYENLLLGIGSWDCCSPIAK